MVTLKLHTLDNKEILVKSDTIITYSFSKGTQNVILITTLGNKEVRESLYEIDQQFNLS